jgi:methylated-DNA-[protein]-cysteine S-methyltransferase
MGVSPMGCFRLMMPLLGNRNMQYAIFKTNWGYAGIAGVDGVLCRTCLPVPDRQSAQRELLRALALTREATQPDESFLSELQERIAAYFEGENVDFSTDPAVNLDGLNAFDRKVLQTCRKIPAGETTTYGELAVRVGHPGAARAVGTALARNPIPLIIPCHRVLRSDGHLGGFSAPGGLTTKQKLLRHEGSPILVTP